MKLASSAIKYSDTKAFTKLFTDYVEGKNKALRELYRYEPSLEAFQQAIADLSEHNYNRKLLVDVLKDQGNSNAGILLNENTFAVCTAHQPCLFTGPLYFIYKIVSAINLAEALGQKYPSNRFVPVYWMGSEDHDFAEVNHVNLFGKRLQWEAPQDGPVGRISTATLKSVIDELARLAGETPNAKELMSLIGSAYNGKNTLAEATRSFVLALFGEYGLVVIDGDDPRLKREFVPVMTDDLQNHSANRLVNASVSKLETLGYQAQVKPREINLFRLSEGKRERIDRSTAAFEKELQQSPENFSPNVVLRPLYQQQVLPAVAYVGGPAEVGYWLEYKTLFAHYKTPYPVVMPRASVLWLDSKQRTQLEKLGLEPARLFQDIAQLEKELVKRNAAGLSLEEEEARLREVFASLSAKAENTDPTLKATAEAELQKALASLEKLGAKMLRSEKQKQETALSQLRKLREKLFPEGQLQERHDNFMYLYLKHGKAFIAGLKQHLGAFQQQFIILSERD